jgi:hypothetical protein
MNQSSVPSEILLNKIKEYQHVKKSYKQKMIDKLKEAVIGLEIERTDEYNLHDQIDKINEDYIVHDFADNSIQLINHLLERIKE